MAVAPSGGVGGGGVGATPLPRPLPWPLPLSAGTEKSMGSPPSSRSSGPGSVVEVLGVGSTGRGAASSSSTSGYSRCSASLLPWRFFTRSVTEPMVAGSMPLMTTFMPLLLAAMTTSEVANGVEPRTPSSLSMAAFTSRHSVKSPSSRVICTCALEPRIFSRRSLSKPLITESTTTSALVPIHTPPTGTTVKKVKKMRRIPK